MLSFLFSLFYNKFKKEGCKARKCLIVKIMTLTITTPITKWKVFDSTTMPFSGVLQLLI